MNSNETGESTFTTIPAEPGWCIAGLMGEADLFLEPIIAWDIERYSRITRKGGAREFFRSVEPITIEGGMEDRRYWLIKEPSGRFTSVSDQSFENEAEAVAYLVQAFEFDQERDRARKLKSEVEKTKVSGCISG